MEKVIVKIVRENDKIELPKYETSGAAGMDVRANITEPIVLGSLERTLVPTGLKIAIPEGYEVQVRPRSGLALKHGITLLNTPGTIDSDYRGELKVPTGLKIAIPEGYEVQVRPRSGLALKHGITLLNTPGTIDSDYRGELKVIIANMSKDSYTINPGERIGQLVLNKVEQIEWEVVETLDETERGAGGFGHTGK